MGAGLLAAVGVAAAFLLPKPSGRDRGVTAAAIAGLSILPDARRAWLQRRR